MNTTYLACHQHYNGTQQHGGSWFTRGTSMSLVLCFTPACTGDAAHTTCPAGRAESRDCGYTEHRGQHIMYFKDTITRLEASSNGTSSMTALNNTRAFCQPLANNAQYCECSVLSSNRNYMYKLLMFPSANRLGIVLQCSACRSNARSLHGPEL